MDAFGVQLGAALLQTRSNTGCPKDEAPDNSILRSSAFTSKSLTGAEKRYSNIDREALGIQYVLEKFHHYCFVRGEYNYNHKPLVTIFKKDVATLLQRLQQILLRIHQYRVRIIYKPGPDLFIVDSLARCKITVMTKMLKYMACS